MSTTNNRRLLIALCFFAIFQVQQGLANSDSLLIIKVHFLHGSKPKHRFRHEENRWFGGILGGHAGVEYTPGEIINFQPKAPIHFFSSRHLINSLFGSNDTVSFYEVLGGNYANMKKTVVFLSVTATQKARLDSVAAAYMAQSPYDYAFFGMRCGAATYDLLAKAGITKPYTIPKTWCKFFYPRKTRRRLEKLAMQQRQPILRQKGSIKRIWEKD